MAIGVNGVDSTASKLAEHVAAASLHSGHEITIRKGSIDGYPALNGDSKMPLDQLPGHTHAEGDVVGLTSDLSGKLPASSLSGVNTITVGTTQPSNPSVGDLWIDTN